MSHSQSFEALVLKTYDIGEADRLCILFTRRRGRIAARASGARKLKSRLGGALLPFQHVHVELKEEGGRWIVAGAIRRDLHAEPSLATFTALEEGVELLMRLVPEEGTLLEVFDATLKFFETPHVLSYTFCLLHLLGLLPGERDMQTSLSPAEQAFISSCRAGGITPPDPACNTRRLQTLRTGFLEEQLSFPLKTSGIIEAMK